jgi:NTE family protein
MSSSPKTINLALQGGGAHGAFTWGVLDRLLEEDDRLKIEGISGTSAGAMNAAALIQGMMSGGAKGARETLTEFWEGVGRLAAFDAPQRSLFDQWMGNWNIDSSPFAAITDAMQRMFSPYQTNPFNLNPLRDMVRKMIDVEAIRASKDTKLFISATNVETGRIRVFETHELSVDVLMASACLPFNFQAVPIGKASYWDGGYVGNPAIFPLIYNCDSPDVVLVQINPLFRAGIPNTSMEIIDRLNEITFNASLISEMRAISFVQKLVDEDHLKGAMADRMKSMNMHVVSAEDELRKLGVASKGNASIDFLHYLRDVGRKAAEQWLQTSWDAIGERSSIDVRAMFLGD